MPLSIDEFCARLDAFRLMSADQARSDLAAFSEGQRPTDGESFAALLVKSGRLTPFQAGRLCDGKDYSLVLGKYVLIDKLGEGGMGTVFKAEHRHMKRIVALKVVKPELLASANAVKRFQREVQVVARLNHPNIVTALDAGEVQGTCFLVMRFVDGRDLASAVRREGPLPVEQAIDAVLQAARGLAHAHQQGIIHRDVKPSNLLLDRAGVVKLLDLGLAALMATHADADDSLTSSRVIMGTPDYLAPEQARGLKHADARSDIYSLGMTLWYLLTGRPAYDVQGAMSKLLAHQQSEIPSLAKACPEIPLDLDAIFHRMVEKHPSDRYESMEEVVAALESLRGERSAGMASASLMETTTLLPLSGAHTDRRGHPDLPATHSLHRRPVSGWLAVAATITLIVLIAFAIRHFRAAGSGSKDVSIATSIPAHPIHQNKKVSVPPPLTELQQSAAAESYRRAAEFVLRRGGRLFLHLAQTDDAAFPSRIEDLPSVPFILHTVNLAGQKDVNDDDMRALKDLSVRELNLSNTSVGDESVCQLQTSRRLRLIVLKGTKVTDDVALTLASSIDLRVLDLSDTQVTDRACRELAKHPLLEDLHLSHTQITDVGLKELAACSNLHALYVAGNKSITAESVAHLQALSRLQILDVSETSLGDEAIKVLARFPQLRNLDMTSTNLSREGAFRLQEALPRAVVMHPELPQLEADEHVDAWVKTQKGTVGKWITEVSDAPFAISNVRFPTNGGPTAGSENLVGLRSIVRLTWPNLRGADSEAVSMASLDSLETLELVGSDLSDDGLRRLTSLSNLIWLNIDGSKVTKAGLSELAALRHLEILSLAETSIKDEDLAPVGKAESLVGLAIVGSPRLTSAGLKHLTGLRNLSTLDMRRTPIDDSAVSHVKQLRSLRFLSLQATKVTSTGVAELHKALPECIIFWDGGALFPAVNNEMENLAR
jgi:serine/threonine protein kinase